MKKLLIIGLTIALTACAQGRYGSSDYAGHEARRVETIRSGTIIGLAPVHIADRPSGVGGLVGAVAGGVAGSSIGAGAGRTLAIIGAGVAGALAGNAIEGSANEHNAIRISVKLGNNEQVAVVQALDEESKYLRIGDRVNLYNSGNTVRVAR